MDQRVFLFGMSAAKNIYHSLLILHKIDVIFDALANIFLLSFNISHRALIFCHKVTLMMFSSESLFLRAIYWQLLPITGNALFHLSH